MEPSVDNQSQSPKLMLHGQRDSNVPECCYDTLTQHSTHNMMMVCSSCKKMIKCFDSESKFKNFVSFCHSRRRDILIGKFEERDLVIYRNV